MSLLALAIYLIVIVVLVALVFWILQQFALPDPLGKVVRVGITVIAVLIVLVLFLRMVGVDTGVNLPPAM